MGGKKEDASEDTELLPPPYPGIIPLTETNNSRIVAESPIDQSNVIKEKFEALSIKVNNIIKEENNMDDRQKFENRQGKVYTAAVVLFILLFISGIIGLWTMERRSSNPVSHFFLVLMGVFGALLVVIVCGFCLFCDNEDEMDKRRDGKIEPVIRDWNSANKEHGVVEYNKAVAGSKNTQASPPRLILRRNGVLQLESELTF